MKNISMKDALIYGVIASLVLAAGFSMFLRPKQPTFAVVDMNRLISQRAQNLAKLRLTGDQSKQKIMPQQIRDLSTNLKEDLDDFAKENGVIILSKGAVAGGHLPDFTEAALSLFEEGERP